MPRHMMSKPSGPSDFIVGSFKFRAGCYSQMKQIPVNKCITSDVFQVCGRQWLLEFYPAGFNELSKEAAIFLRLVDSQTEAQAVFKAEIMYPESGGKFYFKIAGQDDFSSSCTFTFDSPCWGNPSFVRIAFLKYFVKDDTLQFRCTIWVPSIQFDE